MRYSAADSKAQFAGQVLTGEMLIKIVYAVATVDIRFVARM